jgi:hypothetical protein
MSCLLYVKCEYTCHEERASTCDLLYCCINNQHHVSAYRLTRTNGSTWVCLPLQLMVLPKYTVWYVATTKNHPGVYGKLGSPRMLYGVQLILKIYCAPSTHSGVLVLHTHILRTPEYSTVCNNSINRRLLGTRQLKSRRALCQKHRCTLPDYSYSGVLRAW